MTSALRQELSAGVLRGVALAAAVATLAAPAVLWFDRDRSAPAAPPAARSADFGHSQPPDDVRRLAGWVVASGDPGAAPFAIIDKARARLYVFDATGRLRDHTPVLLGVAAGDDSVPGIGERAIEQVQPHERTTPAGRFDAVTGRNLRGEDVVWVDYGAAVSMHRVRTTEPAERRLERLATPSIEDNRVSWGCINVPQDFFDGVLWPALAGRSVVYVMPERKPFETVFPQAAARRT